MRLGRVLRQALALALAAGVMAALAAAVAFVVAGSALGTAEEVRAATLRTGIAALAAFLAFALSFGAAATLALPRLGRTDGRARAAAGAAAGFLFALAVLATGPAGAGPWVPAATALTLAAVGAGLLPLAGALARLLGGGRG